MYRAAHRAEAPAPPRTKDERELESLAAKIVEAERKLEQLREARNRLLHKLWREEGHTQRELADRLTRGARRSDPEAETTRFAVQKALLRMDSPNGA